MPYFPFFANIENMPCLVVGGGQVALRKLEKLLDFSPIIKVVASKACGEIRELADRGMITLFERDFKDSDIDGSTFVITATGDRGVNRHISQLCRQRHIPCNAVDDPESCTFFFPAIVTEGTCALAFQRAEKALPLLLT
jgi:precorrin-2 dehydrogenase/sirohydrochlorin ferrochelatase